MRLNGICNSKERLFHQETQLQAFSRSKVAGKLLNPAPLLTDLWALWRATSRESIIALNGVKFLTPWTGIKW